MKILPLFGTVTALLVIIGCADGSHSFAPTADEASVQAAASAPAALAAQRVPASGDFTALVNFSTLTLTPRGKNCLLEVQGQLVFTGTIDGPATGTTSALVFAPCSEVATTPPGTFPDVFRSELEFTGTVDGEPAQAKVMYQGRVQPGGQIDGHLIFSRGVAGVLD